MNYQNRYLGSSYGRSKTLGPTIDAIPWDGTGHAAADNVVSRAAAVAVVVTGSAAAMRCSAAAMRCPAAAMRCHVAAMRCCDALSCCRDALSRC